MKISGKRLLTRWLPAAIGVYLVIGLVLVLIQDLLLFHPVALPADHTFRFRQRFEEGRFHNGADITHFVKFPVENNRGIVLFFHGNTSNLEWYENYVEYFARNDYEVWVIDYPGFGKSTGRRSEKRMYEDAGRLYAEARQRYKPDRIVIYGKSIGTGIASQLASRADCRMLLLETPYYNVDALARHHFPVYPVIPMTKYSFPNNRHLQKVNAPVFIFHGKKDEIIPYQHAEALKRENKGVHLVSIADGTHNDLASFGRFHQELDSILQLTPPAE